MDTIILQPLGFDAPVAVAARELAAYLPRLAKVEVRVLETLGSLPPQSPVHVVLGTPDHLAAARLGKLPALHPFDDALALLPKHGRLYLTGSNARSVLFAAYRLLEELGCVFLRPGLGGEVVPRLKALDFPTRAIREKASYRNRGICIEGYPRLDHTLDLLDWMAKKKMNAFQLQFRHAGVFWRRGYLESPEMDAATRARGLTEEDCLAADDRVIARAKELGMLIHRVGHGWTAMTLGYTGIEWQEVPEHPVAAEKRPWVAQVNGVRELWHNEPTNTELCYSNPAVRAAFLDEVTAYARQHPEVDLLHVWLSDASNNRCECDGCRTKEPTDWYALLMNELGARLEAEGLPTRVVFLGYNDMLWPPVSERFAWGGLVFMFAPMGRCYRHDLSDDQCGEQFDETAQPALNESWRPFGNRSVSAIARKWQAQRVPDSFIFDYHQWAAVWSDGLGQDLGNTIAGDIKHLREIGLDGMISCQCIRSFYPLPYLENAMGDTLWNASLSPKAHRKRIMSAAFGRYAEEAEAYFAYLVKHVIRGASHAHQSVLRGGEETRDGLTSLTAYVTRAQARFARLAGAAKDEVLQVSLGLLAVHAEQAGWIFRVRLAGLDGDTKQLAAMRAEYERRLPEVLGRFAAWVDPKLAEPVRHALWQAEELAKQTAG
jgi:hypothetical protein